MEDVKYEWIFRPLIFHKVDRSLMLNKFFLYVLLLFIASSCGKEKLPEGVLSKEELAALMVKIYLAEARLSVSLVPRDSADKLFHPFQEKLLKDKGLSDSGMSKTYQYYLSHPKDLELIYDSVIDTLSLREQKAKPPEPKTVVN